MRRTGLLLLVVVLLVAGPVQGATRDRWQRLPCDRAQRAIGHHVPPLRGAYMRCVTRSPLVVSVAVEVEFEDNDFVLITDLWYRVRLANGKLTVRG